MLYFLGKQFLRFIAITLITLVIVVALLSGLLRLGLPYASSYKNEIQHWVGNYLRTPVEIGSMELDWVGLSPNLKLGGIVLKRGGDQRLEVNLDEIWLDVNLYKSLFTGKPQINEVTLAGANLVLEYVGRQQFKIRSYGLNAGKQSSANESSLDVVSWLMNSGRVGLLDSRVRLIDKYRDIDYQIENLNVSADNKGSLHRLRLSMDLPPQLGDALDVELDLTGSSSALENSTGNFYASATGMNVENWMRIWPKRTVAMTGSGNVEFWGAWGDNQLLSVRALMNGPELEIARASERDSLSPANQYLRLTEVAADLFWQRSADGWRAEIDKFDFTHSQNVNRIRDGLVERKKDRGHYTVAANGKSLSLQAIGALLAKLGDTPALARAADYASMADLHGSMSQWQLSATLADTHNTRVSLRADLDSVSAASVGSIPGFENISGQIALANNEGQLLLRSTDLVLNAPKIFSKPIELAKAAADFSVNLNDLSNFIGTENLTVHDHGLDLLSHFTLGRDQDDDLFIDMQVATELDDIAKARDYFPDKLMRERLSRWLDDALVGGRLDSGAMMLHGKLKNFPFTQQPGLFQAEVSARDAEVKFRPNWPSATALNGRAVFTGAGLKFEVEEGNIAGTTLSRIDGEIANYREPMLTLTGANEGSLQSFIDFSNDGPLSSILSPAFADASGSGDAVLNLSLDLPLRPKKFRTEAEKFAVAGTVFLAGNSLDFRRFNVELTDLVGGVAFTETGFEIKNLKASFLGSPIKITAKPSSADGVNQSVLSASGLLHADQVLSQYNIPVHRFFSGPAKWDVDLTLPMSRRTDQNKGSTSIKLSATSDLIGTSVSLPAPLSKTSADAESVSVEGVFAPDGGQNWSVTTSQAKLLTRAVPGQGMRSLDIALGDAAIEPAGKRGIHVYGSSPSVSFDGWIRAVNQIIEDIPRSDGPRTPTIPVFANVVAEQLIVGTQAMGQAKLRVNTDQSYINSVLSSPHLRGSIRVPREHWDKTQSVISRIAYADALLLKALSTGGDPEQPAQPLDPTQFPSLDVHVSRFEFNSFTLNEVGLRAEPDAAGLTVTALGFANDNAQLIGEGYWRLKDPQRFNATSTAGQETRLSLNLQSSDVGRTFADAGFAGIMAEGEGSATINLNWLGPAYKPDLKMLEGEISLYAKDGRLLSIDPGAARLVGLIALQEIPRRLSLDFRDLVRDGLDYKRIDGKITLGEGLAQTEILRLEGTIGVVEIQGDSDLVAQSLDQTIRVLPRVSAALPIIGLLSGGASAGIGALLVAPVLKALGIDIDRIGLTEYTLTGSWDKPEIKAVSGTNVNFSSSDND